MINAHNYLPLLGSESWIGRGPQGAFEVITYPESFERNSFGLLWASEFEVEVSGGDSESISNGDGTESTRGRWSGLTCDGAKREAKRILDILEGRERA